MLPPRVSERPRFTPFFFSARKIEAQKREKEDRGRQDRSSYLLTEAPGPGWRCSQISPGTPSPFPQVHPAKSSTSLPPKVQADGPGSFRHRTHGWVLFCRWVSCPGRSCLHPSSSCGTPAGEPGTQRRGCPRRHPQSEL